MKIKLLENDKIIEVPSYWKWHLVEGKKVIIDQKQKNNCFSYRRIMYKYIQICLEYLSN